ncbi:MAG: peptidylprolyl isomerase [Acidobacteria bacterium]|nr:peptidylprolyl isomerase [Acidobacteriota bacterium]
MYFRGLVLPLALLAAASSSCKKAPSADAAATVNGRPISFSELDKNLQAQFGSASDGENASEDHRQIRRLEVLRILIDNEIMLQRAEKLGLLATDADVEARFNEFKASYTTEEFDRQLKSRGMTVSDLKTQLRRELSLQKLFNKEITSHIAITDADVAGFYNANKNNFNFAEPRVHLAQIVVTPAPDPEVRNLKNDKAQNDEQGRRKIEAVLARLKQGEGFDLVAQSYSEDPNTSPNGGDLGFVPESALEKASVELRRMVAALQPGQISPVIRTAEGYRILKVISKEPAGQRQLNDPRVQQTIRDTLLNRKDQLLKAAYLEVARNDAKVMNHLARNISQNAGRP